jgi:hypothetical protein
LFLPRAARATPALHWTDNGDLLVSTNCHHGESQRFERFALCELHPYREVNSPACAADRSVSTICHHGEGQHFERVALCEPHPDGEVNSPACTADRLVSTNCHHGEGQHFDLKGLPSVSRIPLGKPTHPRVQPTIRSQLTATTVRVNQALYIADLLHLRVHRQLFYNAGSLV